jgi:hypothetical protein
MRDSPLFILINQSEEDCYRDVKKQTNNSGSTHKTPLSPLDGIRLA